MIQEAAILVFFPALDLVNINASKITPAKKDSFLKDHHQVPLITSYQLTVELKCLLKLGFLVNKYLIKFIRITNELALYFSIKIFILLRKRDRKKDHLS